MDMDNSVVIAWGRGVRGLNDNGEEIQWILSKKNKNTTFYSSRKSTVNVY